MKIKLKPYLDCLKDPISLAFFKYPITLDSGHTLDKSLIYSLLEPENPLTRAPLTSADLDRETMNKTVNELVEFFEQFLVTDEEKETQRVKADKEVDIDLSILLPIISIDVDGVSKLPEIPATNANGDLCEKGAGQKKTIVIAGVIDQLRKDFDEALKQGAISPDNCEFACLSFQAILDIELFKLIRFPPLPEASIPLDDRLRKLLELGASPSGFCSADTKNTLLHEAVLQKNTPLVRLLLVHNAGVDSKNKDGATTLDLAIQSKNYELALILIKEAKGEWDKEILSQVLLVLLGQYSQPTQIDGAELLRRKVTLALLKYGADVNRKNKDGETAIQLLEKLDAAVLQPNLPELYRACPIWVKFWGRAA
jgi:hypothetical protein